jgi:hypothetical protein
MTRTFTTLLAISSILGASCDRLGVDEAPPAPEHEAPAANPAPAVAPDEAPQPETPSPAPEPAEVPAAPPAEPAFSVDDELRCWEEADCLLVDGLPAISEDGSVLIDVTATPAVIEIPTVEIFRTFAFRQFRVSDGVVRETIPLIERADVSARVDELLRRDACPPDDEEGCDPLLMELPPAVERRLDREVHRRVAQRVERARSLLEAQPYRALQVVPAPHEGRRGALVHDWENDDDGDVVVRITDATTGDERLVRELPLPCDMECHQLDVKAYWDPPTGVFYLVVSGAREDDVDGTVSVAIVGP